LDHDGQDPPYGMDLLQNLINAKEAAY